MLNEKQFNELSEFYNVVDFLDLEVSFEMYKEYNNFIKNMKHIHIAYLKDCKDIGLQTKIVMKHDLFNYYLKGGF